MPCYIPREYMYLDILHVFYTSQNESKIHFGIHIRYIKIHVSFSLPLCHTGYISGYIRIRVSWTLHQDTSGYTEIRILECTPLYPTCIVNVSRCVMYLRVKLHCSATPPSQSDGSAPLGQQTTQTLWRGIFVHCGTHPHVLASSCQPRENSTSSLYLSFNLETMLIICAKLKRTELAAPDGAIWLVALRTRAPAAR